MAGFFTLQEGARKKIILIVALFLLAAVIAIVTRRSGSSAANTEMALKCRACKHAETMTQEQFEEMSKRQNEMYIEQVARQNPQRAEKLRQLIKNPDRAMDPMSRREINVSLPSWGTRDWPLPCPKCGKNAFFNAIQCPDCGEIFFGEDEHGRPVRICPKCKYNLKSKK